MGRALMKLYLGLLPGDPPTRTRIFGKIGCTLVDLQLACAANLAEKPANRASAYDLAAFYFPRSIAGFLAREEQARRTLDETIQFVSQCAAGDLRGPAGEKIAYDLNEVRLLPPFPNPERSLVIGFSDRARTEALPRAEIPTAFYKLPQTLIASGAPILWPKFSKALDADACLALVIGKAGKSIQPSDAWDHVAGLTLMIDITARDINQREGLTANNLLGKNFPSSTSLGPAMLLKPDRKTFDKLEISLSIDGEAKQRFCPAECVFNLQQIIARWSIIGIKPGDFLAMGASMAIQGRDLQTPAELKMGSVVRCASPAIGELCHAVVAAGDSRR